MSDVKRFQGIMVGGEQMGKTFWVKNFFIPMYIQNGGKVWVYNYGRESDFPSEEYEEVVIIGKEGHKSRIGIGLDEKVKRQLRSAYDNKPKLEIIEMGGQIVGTEGFSAIQPQFCRTPIDDNGLDERLFFKFLFQEIYNTLFIMDDSKEIFLHGMKSEHIKLISKKAHTGGFATSDRNKNGMDIMSMVHSVNDVPNQFWKYATDLFLFKSTEIPSSEKVKDSKVLAKLIEMYNQLKKAPEYTCYSIKLDVNHPEYLIVKNATLTI